VLVGKGKQNFGEGGETNKTSIKHVSNNSPLFDGGKEPPSLSGKARVLTQMSPGANNILHPQPVPTKTAYVELRNRYILIFFDNTRDVLPL